MNHPKQKKKKRDCENALQTGNTQVEVKQVNGTLKRHRNRDKRKQGLGEPSRTQQLNYERQQFPARISRWNRDPGMPGERDGQISPQAGIATTEESSLLKYIMRNFDEITSGEDDRSGDRGLKIFPGSPISLSSLTLSPPCPQLI